MLLARRCAQALIFCAGALTVVNSEFSKLQGVDVDALRVTGLVTMLVSFAIPALPWATRGRMLSYAISIVAIAALVATDSWHHYSRNDAAMAVYPVFFILVIAFTGLTQPRGAATIVAAFSGAALAWILHNGGHGAAAWQCIAVTVPAAAILGEVVSWAHGHAMQLARLDAQRRLAPLTRASSASRLHEALTTAESSAIVVDIANRMFGGHDTSLVFDDPGDREPLLDTANDQPADEDAEYDGASGTLVVKMRGQTGVVGTLTTVIDEPDMFMQDAARLFGRQIGSRLEQLRVIHALTDAATQDELTGIANRRAAQAQIDTLHPDDAVFILDLDHFKAINDSLGHQTGDKVLAEFADYLREHIRPSDSVARYGGEEFLLVARGVTLELAEQIAIRLLDGWRFRRPLVTFSVGYAMHAHGGLPSDTIEHADVALYQAKREGRDRARAFEPYVPASDGPK